MRSLTKNAILNVVQNVCKVLFPLITIPYASRILEAANYGKVSFGYSIVRYFILLAALGISTYTQREAPVFRNDKHKISDFANQVFTINVLSTVFSYSILFLLLTVSYKLRDYRILIVIQSMTIIMGTLGADWINVIYEDFFYITVRYIAIQGLSLLLLFLLVKTPQDYYKYAAVNVFATAGGNLFNIYYIRRYVKLRLVNPGSCVHHLKPILLLFCVSITTVIYVSSDITILGFFMTDADVGIYTMASNIYSVVKQVISAVITVSIPRLAYYLGNHRKGEYRELAQRILDALITILIPAITGLAFLSDHVLNIMGGQDYVSGRPALIVLSCALFFAILAGFYANGCLLLNKKDKTYLFATSLSALLNILLNFVLIPILGITGAAITTLIAEFCMTLIAGQYALRQYQLTINMKTVMSSALGACLIGLICWIVSIMHFSSILTVIISFAAGAAIYYVVLKVTKNPMAMSAEKAIKRIFHREERL